VTRSGLLSASGRVVVRRPRR